MPDPTTAKPPRKSAAERSEQQLIQKPPQRGTALPDPAEHTVACTSKRTSVHLDVEEWLPYLEDPDATDDEKRALIETLWGIVLSFVDLGWDITTETGASSKLPPDKTAPSIDLTQALHDAVVRSDNHQKQKEEV